MKTNQELTINPGEYSMLTDLYQLTMIACYTGTKIADRRASFELFVRHLPDDFGYIIAMGLAQALEYLENLQFSNEQITDLAATGIFRQAPLEFWDLLSSFQFSGDVWAAPEGTAIFGYEPILRVEAPLWQAQLVESYLLNTINYQTLIATKALRMRDAAGEKARILEFGTRRAFSPQASLWAARAAIAAGFDSTSNVLAAIKLGVQPTGTMAHSLVMAIKAIAGTETEAFMAFNNYFPEATILIDTYDTVGAAENLAKMSREGKIHLTGVRIDSGDLVTLSQKVHELLPEVKIFASGDMDEWAIADLKSQGAILDGYGIGTKLVTGKPVNGVYKLVEIEGKPTYKNSQGKATYPGRKQIFRSYHQGKISEDRLGLATELAQETEKPVLELVMQNGQVIKAPDTIDTIKQRCRETLASLPPSCRKLDHPEPIKVKISNNLTPIN